MRDGICIQAPPRGGGETYRWARDADGNLLCRCVYCSALVPPAMMMLHRCGTEEKKA